MLGKLVVNKLSDVNHHCYITAETLNNVVLFPGDSKLINSRLTSQRSKDSLHDNIIISFPPYSDNYVSDVLNTCNLWKGSDFGVLMLISTTGVYSADEAVVNERSNVEITDRTKKYLVITIMLIFIYYIVTFFLFVHLLFRFLEAENLVLSRGGKVIRLAGLYNAFRGAHTYFLGKEEVPYGANGLINLISYDDAADAVLSVMEYSLSSKSNEKNQQIFLFSDFMPITRRELCNIAVESGLFPNSKIPKVKALI